MCENDTLGGSPSFFLYGSRFAAIAYETGTDGAAPALGGCVPDRSGDPTPEGTSIYEEAHRRDGLKGAARNRHLAGEPRRGDPAVRRVRMGTGARTRY